ncbi:MAG: DUF262 domain-containing protein [Chloroflexi bacterium]|nr:DUF262 domain-containing protein [Chloroflexota bacterium]
MTIRELLDDIAKLDIVLPEFQREYVWQREQAKQLMVSLFKAYPTGSLLFWKTANPPDIKNSTISPDKIGTTEVILDGQQRLTTLYLLIKGEIPPYYRESDIENDPRNLYFNLEDGDFQYYQSTRMDNNPTWLPVTDCFASRSEINPIEIAQFKSDDRETLGDRANRYYSNLNRLHSIENRPYPIQMVPASATIDDAINVFDRVNSLGTKLTDADLALAHITGKWPQARREMKRKLDNLAAKRFQFDLTFLVRSLTGVVLNRALFEAIHETPKHELEEGWRKLAKILDYLVSLLPGRAWIHSTDDLNSTNVLVPVVVYLARYGMEFHDDVQLRRCIHWLYAANMWARYTGQTDQRLDHDLTVIQRTQHPWDELVGAIIDQRGRIEVKASDFEGRAIQHPLYRMSYVIIKGLGAVDWFNGASLADPHGRSYQIHSHHIFPTSLLYSREGGYSSENHLHKKLVNEIANRAFLTGDTNLSLSNSEPIEYLGQVQGQYPGALKNQLVPLDPSLWHLERYEEFLAERRHLLAEAINARMAYLLVPQEEEPEVLSIPDLVELGESITLEFKSSIRWDLRQNQVNKALEKVIAKSVAGFLNAEGGTLLIGVADDGTILGLDDDVRSLGRSDLDGLQQHLVQILDNALGTEFMQYLHVVLERVDDRHVCRIDVKQSAQPVYVKDGHGSEFYVRVGNTSRPLDIEKAHEYISMHWQA